MAYMVKTTLFFIFSFSLLGPSIISAPISQTSPFLFVLLGGEARLHVHRKQEVKILSHACVTLDGGLDWILDLLTAYTHDSELQAVTLLISPQFTNHHSTR
jgi:hypothetical protein